MSGRFATAVVIVVLCSGFAHAEGFRPSQDALDKVGVPFVQNSRVDRADVAFSGQTSYGTLTIARDGVLHYAIKQGPQRFHTLSERIRGNTASVRGGVASTVSMRTISQRSGTAQTLVAFDTVNLNDIAPGLVVELKAHGSNVEKLFHVSPGLSAEGIRVRVDGVETLKVASDGRLIASGANSETQFTKPVAYQQIKGKRVPVEVAYVTDGLEYGFRVGTYNRRHELIIDPLVSLVEALSQLTQTTFMGGNKDDQAWAVAVNESTGQVYVAGGSRSPDLSTSGAPQTALNSASFSDAFVSVYNSTLTQLIRTTYFGGSNHDEARAIAVNPNTGDVYVAGWSSSASLPGLAGAEQIANAGKDDAFVARFNSGLTVLFQSTFFGGSETDDAQAIALSSNGEVYVGGSTSSTNLPKTTSGAATTNGGLGDGFVVRLNPTLTQFINATYFGGTDTELGFGLVIDQALADTVFLAGSTRSTTLPGTASAAQPNSGGGSRDGFVASFNKELTTLKAATFYGNWGDDFVRAITLDPTAHVLYITGDTTSSVLPKTTGAVYPSFKAYTDVFVASLQSNLGAINRSTFFGGYGYDSATGIVFNKQLAELFVVGQTTSLSLPKAAGGAQSSLSPGPGAGSDGFVARFTAPLKHNHLTTYMGSADAIELPHAVAVSLTSGNVYMVGQTEGYPVTSAPTLPAVTGGAQSSFGGGDNDGFVARYHYAYKSVDWAEAPIKIFGTGGGGTP